MTARPAGLNATLVVAGVLTQGYAVLLLALSWPAYRRPEPVVAVLVGLMLTLPTLVLIGRRATPRSADGLAAAEAPPSAALLVLVATTVGDLVVPALCPSGQALGSAAWNWGAVTVLLMALAAYRPAAEVVALTALHLLFALVWAQRDHAAPLAVAVVAGACAVPPLASMDFIRHYRQTLLARRRAQVRQEALRARTAALTAVRADRAARLQRLREEARPLLAAVAQGRLPVPLPPEQAALARRLAESTRRELVGDGSLDWLLRSGAAARAGNLVSVNASPTASAALSVAAGARLSAVTDLLAAQGSPAGSPPGAHDLSVTVSGPVEGDLLAVVSLRGPAATALADSPRLASALAVLPGESWLDGPEHLVIEARLPVAADARADRQEVR